MVRSSFFKKTAVLIISNIISGTLTLIFSVILSRQIGARGMGLYQLVIPFYGMLLFITNGGISVTVSRMAAEKKTMGNLREMYRTVRVMCIFEVIWSVIVTGLIIIFAKTIASKILSDDRTFYSILAFCPALIITSIAAVYKGAYYGLQRVFEPAAIDIVEKFSKIIIMYPLVILTARVALEFSTAAAVFAISLGEFVSLVLFFVSFEFYKNHNPGYGKCDNDFQLIFNIIKISIPVGSEGIVTALFGIATAVLIPRRLQLTGISYEESLSMLGKLQGMALNIIFYPLIITNAFNMLVIPAISEALVQRNNKILNHRINTAIRLASLTAFSTAAVILSIPHEVGILFYNDMVVGEILFILAPAMPIVYIELSTYAIINGLGEQIKLLLNSIIVQTLDLVLLYYFVSMPSLNVKGYALNFIISAVFGIYFNFRLIHKTIEYNFNLFETVILPGLCAVLLYILTANFLVYIHSTPIVITTAFLVYALIYMPLHKFTRDKQITDFFN